MIGNSKITIRRWGSTQDDTGGNSKLEIANWNLRADVDDRSGSTSQGQGSELTRYDYKIKVRHEKSRVITTTDTVDYDGKRLAINSVEIKKESDRAYSILRCSTIETLSVDTSYSNYTVTTARYTASGGENSFTTTDRGVLFNKVIIGAFKDGIEYEVILSGAPVDKQVKYIRSTGQFIWSVSFFAGEKATIQFANA